jgi:hypothetical protein
MEREPGRLQLRYVLFLGEGVCDVVVDEDDDAVTVHGFICAGENQEPVDCTQSCACPVHIYLDRPLGNRAVIDGHTNRRVPFRDVYAEIEAREQRRRRAARGRL